MVNHDVVSVDLVIRGFFDAFHGRTKGIDFRVVDTRTTLDIDESLIQ
jgi:hypothetical protein